MGIPNFHGFSKFTKFYVVITLWIEDLLELIFIKKKKRFVSVCSELISGPRILKKSMNVGLPLNVTNSL